MDESRILSIKEKLLTFDDFNYASINHELELGSLNKKVVTLDASLKHGMFRGEQYLDESLTPRAVMSENQDLTKGEGDTFVLDKTQDLNNSFGNNININELSLDVHLDISKQIK